MQLYLNENKAQRNKRTTEHRQRDNRFGIKSIYIYTQNKFIIIITTTITIHIIYPFQVQIATKISIPNWYNRNWCKIYIFVKTRRPHFIPSFRDLKKALSYKKHNSALSASIWTTVVGRWKSKVIIISITIVVHLTCWNRKGVRKKQPVWFSIKDDVVMSDLLVSRREFSL